MTHFAKVQDGVVTKVIVAEPEFFDTFVDSSPGEWLETSRKNYAGIGFSYDKDREAFIPLKTFPSWILNEDTFNWGAPIPYPDDGERYRWNEQTQGWDQIDD